VTAPQSVASLRQRLGRSGRRGDAATLRLFITEKELTDKKDHPLDRLRLELFQSVAMVNLLLGKWFEPADTGQYHFSTLVQQTLSVVGHYGSVRAEQIWRLLCGTGPFGNVEQKTYALLLRAMGEQDLLSQTADGALILGLRGERMVERFTFHSAFSTPEEYRLEHAGKTLGSIPVARPLPLGQLIVFAGRHWEVALVAEEEKRISLKPASGGRPPRFLGGGQALHDGVRREMYRLYSSEEAPVFCDREALRLFEEGRRSFRELGLESTPMLESGDAVTLWPWLGDKTVNTVAMLLHFSGLKAGGFSGVIEARGADLAACKRALKDILASPRPQGCDLAAKVPNTFIEKHDALVPKKLRELNYAAKFFDVDSAWRWMSGLDLE
jgi:ATP-dependent Lhr-like helicase